MKALMQINRIAVATGLALASSSLLAAPVFVGPAIDKTALGTVNPAADPAVAKAGFQQRLLTETIKTETFSNYALSTSGTIDTLALSKLNSDSPSGNQRVTLNIDSPSVGGGEVVNSSLDPAVDGRFDTTGDTGTGSKQWWLSAYSFTLSFTQGISAFGFYGTDFGDFLGSFEIELLRAGQVVGSETLKTATTIPMGGPPAENANNGWLQFFAFYDPDGGTYDGIRFKITQQAGIDPDDYDFIGFDDFVIGQLAPGGGGGNAPEPGSLALVGASLLALGAARRRRKA